MEVLGKELAKVHAQRREAGEEGASFAVLGAALAACNKGAPRGGA